MTKYIAYYRVSTKQQGNSGLGLESQRAAVARFGTVEDSFTEIESGRNSKRPILAQAFAACKAKGATLVVARLDRLARSVAFTSFLMQSGVDFVACDLPSANRFVIHLMAAMAEFEAELISQRTKDGLAASRKKKGGWRGARPNIGIIQHTIPMEVVLQIQQLREDGCTYQEIADRLNDQQLTTSRGNTFSRRAVFDIFTKYERSK